MNLGTVCKAPVVGAEGLEGLFMKVVLISQARLCGRYCASSLSPGGWLDHGRTPSHTSGPGHSRYKVRAEAHRVGVGWL